MEISTINLSDVVLKTLSFRIDAEFFQKVYVIQDEIISKNNFQKLGSITEKIDVGFVGSMTQHYRDQGITLLQTKNIQSFFIDDSNTIKITSTFHNELQKSQIRKNDILIARSGSFGKAAIYLEKNIINSSDIIIIQCKEELINPFFLTAFLNSHIGESQMIRFASGGLQGHVNLTILEELEVPQLDYDFQKKVETIVQTAYSSLIYSKEAYNQAEELLLNELNLNNFQPNEQGINIKSLKDSFLTSGRLDAEYYQPKFDAMIQNVKQFAHDKLSNLVNIKKSIEPGSEAYQEDGIPFYRVSNLTLQGLSQPDIHLDRQAYSHVLKPKKDTVLLTKDGTVGMAYKVMQDIDGITSGAILHLTVKDKNKLLPDYLTLVLNSIVVQLQAERDAGGSIIQHWKPSEIEEVIIPILDIKDQQAISELIQQSFTLKSQSEKLLEDAKKLVEMAIEEGEEAALVWYKDK